MSIVLTSFEPASPFAVQALPTYRPDECLLAVEWRVLGPLPKLSDKEVVLGVRKDKLWLDTVFEVFGRFGESPAYWETNVSLDGAWNAYHFDSYRAGMRETERVSVAALYWHERAPQSWRFTVEYQVNPEPLPLRLGFACILHPGPFHFAVRHAATKPDFHALESFAFVLSSLTP